MLNDPGVPVNWTRAQTEEAKTGKWAVTMTKVRIWQVLSRTRSTFTFLGRAGRESTGVVDLIAVRKDHGEPIRGSKRGDVLQIILIQVKWGSAAMPTVEDGKRLSVVAKRLRARHVLLAAWKKGFAAPFFRYRPRTAARRQWAEVSDLDAIFR
jgi:hypothetical protein